MNLLAEEKMPAGMAYPPALYRLVGRGLTHFEPWFIFNAEEAAQRLEGLRRRYPSRVLLPFARREDNDDVACFERERSGQVVIVHDFASPGSEDREALDGFYSWVRRAVEDMIEFDELED